jgi:hypothetical protein
MDGNPRSFSHRYVLESGMPFDLGEGNWSLQLQLASDVDHEPNWVVWSTFGIGVFRIGIPCSAVWIARPRNHGGTYHRRRIGVGMVE